MKRDYTTPEVAIIRGCAPLMVDFLIATSGQSQVNAMSPERETPAAGL